MAIYVKTKLASSPLYSDYRHPGLKSAKLDPSMETKPPFEYKITGTVHPKSSGYSTDPNVEYRSGFTDTAGMSKWTWTIKDAEIQVMLNTERPLEENSETLSTLRNVIRSGIEMQVGIFCVAHSYAYSIELFEIIRPDTDWKSTFTVELESIPNEVAVGHSAALHKKAFELAGANLDALFVLKESFAEFQRGILFPDSSPMHFFRSIEAIRNLVWRLKTGSFESQDRNRQWDALYNIVGRDLQPDIQKLTLIATETRHGKSPACSSADRIAWGALSRKIIITALERL